MLIVNINDTEMQLADLIDAVAREEIIIIKDGKPVARMVHIEPAFRPVTLGLMKGRIKIADDFDAPLPEEILSAFEGK